MDIDSKKELIRLKNRIGFFVSRLISYPLIAPEHVYFSLTNHCNLKCLMCDVYKDDNCRETELSTEKIKNIVVQIKKMRVKHLILSGGEPLLRDDLIEIIEFSVKQGIDMVDIISNGTLLNDNIIEKLVVAGLNHITISLDGLKDINDEIRGKGSFAKAETSIDKINYYKNKYGKNTPTIGINFTIMDKNIDDMIPIIEFAKSKHCNIIVFQPLLFSNTKMYEKKRNPLWPQGDSIDNLRVKVNQIIEIKKSNVGIYIYTDNFILLSLSDYFNGIRPKSNFKCYEGIKRIVITPDGKLWSCPGVYGDLGKKEMKSIWYSKQALKMRMKVRRYKKHCLQDCVYFPSTFIKDIRNFFRQKYNKV